MLLLHEQAVPDDSLSGDFPAIWPDMKDPVHGQADRHLRGFFRSIPMSCSAVGQASWKKQFLPNWMEMLQHARAQRPFKWAGKIIEGQAKGTFDT